MPNNKEYLENILPELEGLKREAEEVIESYIAGVLDKRMKEVIRYKVWSEILG